MSATATLLSFSTTTPLEPAPAVMTRSGRFSPRRRVPSNKRDRSAYLAGLQPPPPLSSPPPSPTCVTTMFAAPTMYHRQSKQKVRFDWKINVHDDERVYDNDSNNRHESEGALWYSAKDIARMRQEYQDLALALREQAKIMSHDAANNNNNNNSDNWQEALRRVYQTAARAADVDDLAAMFLLPQPKAAVVPADLSGLEMAAVTYIALDTASRKHRLYARVQMCQAAVRDPAVRAEMLRQCSRTLSRPARLTARHLAVLSSSSSSSSSHDDEGNDA